MKRPGMSWTFLVILSLWLAPLNARAQANRSNPFIWQVILEYDIGQSNKSATYDNGTSVKLYSQDFQTVFSHNDVYGDNQRLLLDFGDSCPGTAIADIQNLNGDTATSPSMMSQPSIALIQRAGRCEMWSDKIGTAQSLSDAYRLNVGAVLIYDNRSSSAATIIRESPSNSSYPIWSTPLPQDRDASYMNDNNVASSLSDVFVSVYFVPNAYGLALKDMVRNYTSAPSGDMKQRYLQLAMYFYETTVATADNNDPTLNNDSDNMWSIFSGNKGYVAYLIGGAVVFVLLLLVLRWYRCSRTSSRHYTQWGGADELSAAENANGSGDMGLHAVAGMMHRDKKHKMSLLKLNDMCPVQTWQEGSTTNTVCAICLEDLKALDNIRVLPCHHGFCVACIDVWLTKKASLCPICKYDCDPIEQDDLLSSSSVVLDASSEYPSPPDHSNTAPPRHSEAAITHEDEESSCPQPPPPQPNSAHEDRPHSDDANETVARQRDEGSRIQNTHQPATEEEPSPTGAATTTTTTRPSPPTTTTSTITSTTTTTLTLSKPE